MTFIPLAASWSRAASHKLLIVYTFHRPTGIEDAQIGGVCHGLALEKMRWLG
jgi:hypothetical protein